VHHTTEMRIHILLAVLFCMPNRTNGILLVDTKVLVHKSTDVAKQNIFSKQEYFESSSWKAVAVAIKEAQQHSDYPQHAQHTRALNTTTGQVAVQHYSKPTYIQRHRVRGIIEPHTRAEH
jgi:hypothetical protein